MQQIPMFDMEYVSIDRRVGSNPAIRSSFNGNDQDNDQGNDQDNDQGMDTLSTPVP